jgi:hypothetical protein
MDHPAVLGQSAITELVVPVFRISLVTQTLFAKFGRPIVVVALPNVLNGATLPLIHPVVHRPVAVTPKLRPANAIVAANVFQGRRRIVPMGVMALIALPCWPRAVGVPRMGSARVAPVV